MDAKKQDKKTAGYFYCFAHAVNYLPDVLKLVIK
jgi:hypothetical protein